jgi:stage II sporulation protein P
VLLVTGRMIVVDDEFLTSDNRLFRVISVERRTALARFVEDFDMKKHLEENFRSQVLAVVAANAAQGDDGERDDLLEEGPRRLVGIYHTHNAESYIPSDGTHSINGKGGIHQVGNAFKEALEAQGVRVIHDETLHLPHDRGAYRRSRVTAQRLLAQGPDVIFDIHRDAAPSDAYAAQIDGTWITQVMFVVGRQNHNFSINRSFAFDLKGYADDLQPELVKGVFFGHGNYNQDLTPLKLLLEVGSHQNTREAAERGIQEFADTVDFYFYGPAEGEPGPNVPGAGAPSRTRLGFWAALRTIFGILAFLLIGGLGLLWINAGSSEEFLRITSQYLGKTREGWERTRISLRENWAYERDMAVIKEKWQWLKDRVAEIRRQRLK